MPKLLNAQGGYVVPGGLDLTKSEIKNARAQNLGSAPANPVSGQFYYSTADNTLYWWDGTVWVAARSGSGSPTGAAGGALTGSYPNPGLAANSVGATQVADGSLTDVEFAATNKDGTAATPSLRTLGTGSQQAAAGNDTRLSDTRTPTDGTVTDAKVASNAAIALSKLAVDPRQRSTHTGTQAAATISDLAGTVQAYPLSVFAQPTTPVNFGGQRASNAADPVAATDLTTKQYVDNAVTGLDPKGSVRAATTGNITLSGTQTVDGVALSVGDRVLVKDQTNQAQNGIYVVAAGGWTRATDADSWTELVSAYTFVEAAAANNTNANTGWVCTVSPGGTLNTNPVTFVQFTGTGQINAGQGLTKTGNSLDVVGGTGIVVGADTVSIDTGVVTRWVTALVGNGAATSIGVPHGLNNQFVGVWVYDASTNEQVDCGVVLTSATVTTLSFASAPATNSIRVVIHG